MHNPLFNKDLISISDLSRSDIEFILKLASQFQQHPTANLLEGRILANCFYEPSTRTRLSFEAAMFKLGGQVMGFADPANTSSGSKGESLSDSVQVISSYSDILVIRHPQAGAARLAAEVSNVPVINAGDGGNQHPSQTLLDLFSIQQTQGKLDELSIAMVGDLKYGRTVHSLAEAFAHFNARLYFVAPEGLNMPSSICDLLRKKGIRFSFHQDIQEVIGKVDVLYMTRLQKERFNNTELQHFKEQWILSPELLKEAKSNLKVLHPLPRNEEIAKTVDALPQAYYFQQAANGIPVRQAIIAALLCKEPGVPLKKQVA
ncbi:MAG: aspartate carbamoyltransferase [Gammaproteobacteria bacterium]|jgi:aspartate carbamoyltransferase catalytic subunit|nr:aspartate carbamoyltransferase [Gammaproteobacteria bacterium]